MPFYSYTALNEVGRTIKGSLTGVNETDLQNRLESIGLDLITCKEQRQKGTLFKKISQKELIILCIQLQQLDMAGVPLLDAIADIRDTANSARFKGLMSDVYESLKGGNMLSAALATHPETFDEVFVGLIAAGEQTGQLSMVLAHLADHLKWNAEIRKKIKGATYYPIFLLFIMSGIVALMMAFVVPQLTKFLLAQNFELPFYTKALIDTSHFITSYWYMVIGAIITLVIAIKVTLRTSPYMAYQADRLKLSLPIIGAIIRKTEMATFCRFFSITFRSGIGILECMDISGSVVTNKVIKESVIIARKSVSEGNSLNESLRVSNHFPDLVLRMFKVGENSGNLDTCLETVNFFYDKEVDDSVNRLISVIQPTLTIAMGALMMWISISIFGPLYGNFSKMKI